MKNVLQGLFFYAVENCSEPLIDCYETADDLVFEIDLPGINPADASINVYEDLLIIEGMKTDDESISGDLKYLCMERSTKDFRRVIKMPIHINTIAGEAFYANGVITIKFPKLKGKLIKINIERR